MWLIYSVLTALIWGTAELFYKKGAKPDEKYSHLKITICVGLVMGIHAIYTLFAENVDYNFMNLLNYLPVSMLYILSMSFSYFGMRFLAESISDPIENTAGAITAILCFFILKQTMSQLALVSVILIVIGVVLLGIF